MRYTTKTKTSTPRDWIRKPTDHLRIHLAKRNEPVDRLAEGDLRMETMETLHAKEATKTIKNNQILHLRPKHPTKIEPRSEASNNDDGRRRGKIS